MFRQRGPKVAENYKRHDLRILLKVLLNSRSIGFKKALTKNLHRLKNSKPEQSYKLMQVLYIHTHTSYNKPGTGDIIELIMSRKSGGCCVTVSLCWTDRGVTVNCVWLTCMIHEH